MNRNPPHSAATPLHTVFPTRDRRATSGPLSQLTRGVWTRVKLSSRRGPLRPGDHCMTIKGRRGDGVKLGSVGQVLLRSGPRPWLGRGAFASFDVVSVVCNWRVSFNNPNTTLVPKARGMEA